MDTKRLSRCCASFADLRGIFRAHLYQRTRMEASRQAATQPRDAAALATTTARRRDDDEAAAHLPAVCADMQARRLRVRVGRRRRNRASDARNTPPSRGTVKFPRPAPGWNRSALKIRLKRRAQGPYLSSAYMLKS